MQVLIAGPVNLADVEPDLGFLRLRSMAIYAGRTQELHLSVRQPVSSNRELRDNENKKTKSCPHRLDAPSN